jgi:hypothetical protein
MRALVLAPFLECPAAERQRSESRQYSFADRDRAGSDDGAFRDFVPARDLFADLRACKLPKHHAHSLLNRLEV